MSPTLPRKHLTILLAIVAGGLGLRLIGSARSLWGDEFFSLYWAQRGLHYLWHEGFAQEYNPPLYYTIILSWTKLFGTSEIALRLPGILASVAAIPLVYAIAARLFTPRAGLIAAALYAVNGLQISLAVYARTYGLQTFLAAGCLYGMTLLFSATDRRGKIMGTLVYIFSATALAYTHYTQAFLLAALGIAGLVYAVRTKTGLAHWLMANLLVLAATAPEIHYMLLLSGTKMTWLKMPMQFVPGTIELFAAGVEYSGIAAILCAIVGYTVWRLWKPMTPLARLVLILGPGFFVTILTLGNIWLTIFHDKSLVILSVPVSIVLAVAADAMKPKDRMAFLAILLALYASGFPRGAEVTPYRAMFDSLPRPIDRNTYIVFGPHDQIAAIGYYRPDLAHDKIYHWNADDILPPDLPFFMDTRLWITLFSVDPMDTQRLEQLIADQKHIYLVTNTAIYNMFEPKFGRAPDHVMGEGLVRLYEWQGTSK